LRSAYEKLLEIPPDEKNYPYIRKMLERESTEDEVFHLLTHKDFECALYGIAKFKKANDISLIKEQLQFTWRLSNISFQLMQDFPNEEYMDILEKYYQREFYDCNRIYWKNVDWYSSTLSFVRSVASYRNERSAKILDSILHKKPFFPCIRTPEYISEIKKELIYAILDNPCDAYINIGADVGNQFGKTIQEYRHERFVPERAILRPKNPAEPISWR